MKKKQNILATIVCITAMIAAVAALMACGDAGSDSSAGQNPSDDSSTAQNPDDGSNAAQGETIIYGRDGHPNVIPDKIETIISIAPSNTEILVALGFGDKIVQTDNYSADVQGIKSGISNYDMMALDIEHIISLSPDVVFVAGIPRMSDGNDPLNQITSAGISVIYIPPANSIADILEDIRFIAAVLGADTAGESIVSDMESEIERISGIANTIIEKKRVYFEISPAPDMWTFGAGTYMNELLEITGAVNIFADSEGWSSVSDEVLLEQNPDVILTTTNFLDDPIAEIMTRPGWDTITAVQTNSVYYIDNNSSSRQNQTILIALKQIANSVYPEYY